MVHDRLPDPEAWKKFQDMEDIEEGDYDVADDDVIDVTDDKFDLEDAFTRERRHTFGGANTKLTRRYQLYARTGYHIQIMPDGTVSSTMKDHDTYGKPKKYLELF